MKASNASNPFDTTMFGAEAEKGNGVEVNESGSDVIDGGPTGTRLVGTASVTFQTCVVLETGDVLKAGEVLGIWETTSETTWVTTTARGTVSVTTEDPSRPHPAQLFVSVVKGTTGGAVAVAQTVYVMQDVTTTSCARSVLQTAVYVTVEVTVRTLAATELTRSTATKELVPLGTGA